MGGTSQCATRVSRRAKFRNIEETELAKQKLVEERMKKYVLTFALW